MLKIVVCVKGVPDPREASKIKIDPLTKTLLRDNVQMVINPIDRHALEAAMQLKRAGEARVTILSMGPPPVGNIIKECLSYGADQGILLSDPAFSGADAYATAITLAKGIEKIGAFDLVLCGMASSDGSTEWVGPQLATFLKAPVVTMVREIYYGLGNNWLVKADWEDGYRLVEVQLPAVLTVTRSLNQPQSLSFSGIIKARHKTITVWTLSELETPPETIGAKGSPTFVDHFEVIKYKRSVKMLSGTKEEKADALIDILTGAGAIS